jgi:hypothetical protein
MAAPILSRAAIFLAPLLSVRLSYGCRMRGTSCCWSAPAPSWSACSPERAGCRCLPSGAIAAGSCWCPGCRSCPAQLHRNFYTVLHQPASIPCPFCCAGAARVPATPQLASRLQPLCRLAPGQRRQRPGRQQLAVAAGAACRRNCDCGPDSGMAAQRVCLSHSAAPAAPAAAAIASRGRPAPGAATAAAHPCPASLLVCCSFRRHYQRHHRRQQQQPGQRRGQRRRQHRCQRCLRVLLFGFWAPGEWLLLLLLADFRHEVSGSCFSMSPRHPTCTWPVCLGCALCCRWC